MNWGENFWIWMATELFFGIFVALLLYYYFVKPAQKERNEQNNKKN